MWIGHWCLQVLLWETGVFVMPPCSVMLRLTEAETLGDEGKLTAADLTTRDSNGSVTPSFVFWRLCWRSNLALCDPVTAAGLVGGSQPCGEISISYSSRTAAFMEKRQSKTHFLHFGAEKKKQKIK